MLFLVRHAKAGHRNNDLPDDSKRPLTPAGWRQAHALVPRLVAAHATGPVLSSPYLRCVQTVEPLAERLETTVVDDDRLAESHSFVPLIDLLEQLSDGAVLCSHGDIIPEVVQALERRGCRIVGQPHWKKASVWALERDPTGRFVTASAWPPPADDR